MSKESAGILMFRATRGELECLLGLEQAVEKIIPAQAAFLVEIQKVYI